MENAGKLIEDEELREQIKGAGIGTSAVSYTHQMRIRDRNNCIT